MGAMVVGGTVEVHRCLTSRPGRSSRLLLFPLAESLAYDSIVDKRSMYRSVVLHCLVLLIRLLSRVRARRSERTVCQHWVSVSLSNKRVTVLSGSDYRKRWYQYM